MGCLNEVRKYVPNFAYTYYYGVATLPNKFNDKIIVNHDKNIISWNEENKNLIQPVGSYIIIENVINSVELHHFISNEIIPLEDIIKCYLQIFNALHTAYEMFNYTHCDLHIGNILVRKFKNSCKCSYRK